MALISAIKATDSCLRRVRTPTSECVRSGLEVVVKGRSSKLGAAIENHSDLVRLFRMIHTMMGNVPRLTRICFKDFLTDLLCVTFIDYFVDEGYVVVPVL